LALDSAGNPAIAYWAADEVNDYNLILMYWKPAGSAAPTRIMDSQKFIRTAIVVNQGLFKRNHLRMTSALLRFFGSGVIHQITAHHLSGKSNEVSSVASFRRSLPKNLNVNFVDQCSRLKSMIRPFPPQLMGGHAPKVAVEKFEKPAFRRPVSFDNSLQQLGHLSWNRDHGATMSDSHCSPRRCALGQPAIAFLS